MSDGHFRPALITSLVAFIVAILIGAVIVWQDPQTGEMMVSMMQDQVFDQIMDENPALLSAKLFVNNLGASVLLFLGGASFGLVTAMIITINGVVIGVVIESLKQQAGLLYLAAGIIPHGIFEIPAFIISGALGLMLAEALWLDLRGSGDASESARILGRRFILTVIPLLAVAAFIEGFITPEILNLVTQGV